ncbi:hypothetical protein Tco_0520625 [Tanacetum coccineum]
MVNVSIVRKAEAKDAARGALKSPWWTLGCRYQPMGNSDLIGGGGPTSVLAEVPVNMGNNRNNVSAPHNLFMRLFGWCIIRGLAMFLRLAVIAAKTHDLDGACGCENGRLAGVRMGCSSSSRDGISCWS